MLRVRQWDRKLREVRMFVRAMQSGSHPILAQIVSIRRCNLDCAYCNQYDKTSAPVPLETMLRRIDRLGELGTACRSASITSRPTIFRKSLRVLDRKLEWLAEYARFGVAINSVLGAALRPRALLLAAAWQARHSAGTIHRRQHPARSGTGRR